MVNMGWVYYRSHMKMKLMILCLFVFGPQMAMHSSVHHNEYRQDHLKLLDRLPEVYLELNKQLMSPCTG